jgi:hypothetical protein
MFRQVPPLDFFETILRHLGFTGLDDRRWFAKEDLRLENLETWLPLLEPFYLPCKAKRYIHGSMNAQRVMTLVRHLCHAHAIQLQTQEKVLKGKKTTLYQILSPIHQTLVSFH